MCADDDKHAGAWQKHHPTYGRCTAGDSDRRQQIECAAALAVASTTIVAATVQTKFTAIAQDRHGVDATPRHSRW